MKIKLKIKNRIKQLEKEKSCLSNGARSKYGFAIGELQWILNELDDKNE